MQIRAPFHFYVASDALTPPPPPAMHRLPSPSRPLLSAMASRCRWPPALARRLDPPLRGVSSEAAWGWGQDANLHDGDEDPRSASKGRRTTEIVIKEDEEEASDYEFSLGNVIEKSGHRDGSITHQLFSLGHWCLLSASCAPPYIHTYISDCDHRD
ncbi:hypothetical protein ZWY2020_036111 [Hordeum vulgare]|nr:hypothetical protein ZWY2020_036111 [Hordeum vulgare]